MRILHIFDVSNFIYAGNYRNTNATRGVREFDGMYEPNRAPVGGITYLADAVLETMLGDTNDILLAFDRKPEKKREDYTNVFGYNSDYKGQRTPDYKIFLQKEYAEKLMKAANVPCAFKTSYEADDVIYSTWKKFYNEYDYIRIHTEDSDLAFMVDTKTELLPVKKSSKRHITVENYDYTINSQKVIPYNLAILTKTVYGDKADNIPGLKDKKLWLSYIVSSMRKLNYTYPDCGDIEICREILLDVVNEHPELEDGYMAISILNLVTPYLINLEDVDEPAHDINVPMLKSISGIVKPSTEFPIIENILEEYIHEYGNL